MKLRVQCAEADSFRNGKGAQCVNRTAFCHRQQLAVPRTGCGRQGDWRLVETAQAVFLLYNVTYCPVDAALVSTKPPEGVRSLAKAITIATESTEGATRSTPALPLCLDSFIEGAELCSDVEASRRSDHDRTPKWL